MSKDGPLMTLVKEFSNREPIPDEVENELVRADATLHLSSDRPTVRPGETVFVTAWILGAKDRVPWNGGVTSARGRSEGQHSGKINIRVKGPKGDTVYTVSVQVADSISPIGLQWNVPEQQEGGEYDIVVSKDDSPYIQSNLPNFSPAKRSITVRGGVFARQPSLRLALEFDREGFAPGDTLTATLTASQAKGGALEDAARGDVSILVDGILLFQSNNLLFVHGPTSSTMKLSARLDVPPNLLAAVGTSTWRPGLKGTLSVRVRNGNGEVETATRQLPIASPDSISLEMFGEGGDLVAGLTTRLYVEGRFDNGEPADFEAEILQVPFDCEQKDDELKESHLAGSSSVATVKTSHEGRGVSTLFTPRLEKPSSPFSCLKHVLRITSMEGARLQPLPQVMGHGATIRPAGPSSEGEYLQQSKLKQAMGHLMGGIVGKPKYPENDVNRPACFGADGTLALVVAVSDPGNYEVVLSRKGWELDAVQVQFKQSGNFKNVILRAFPVPEFSSDGVLRVTVYNKNGGRAVAERLVWKEPNKHLSFSVEVNGQPVSAQRTATVLPGGPVNLTVNTEPGTVLAVKVVDSRARLLQPQRRRPPSLPVMVLIEDEVLELTDAGAYEISADDDIRGNEARTTREHRIDLLLGTQGWRRFAWQSSNIRDYLLGNKAAAKEAVQRTMLWTTKPKEKSKIFMMKHMRHGMPKLGRAAIPQQVDMMEMAMGEVVEDEKVDFFAIDEAAAGGAAPVIAMAAMAAPAVPAAMMKFAEQGDLVNLGIAGDEVDVLLQHPIAGGIRAEPMPLANNAPPPPMMAKRLADDNWEPQRRAARFPRPSSRPQTVREYRHLNAQKDVAAADRVRRDFAETILWSSFAKADSQGVARWSFDASDLESAFTVAVDGALGGFFGNIQIDAFFTSQTLFVSPKLPASAVVGDIIQTPFTVRTEMSISAGKNQVSVQMELSASNGVVIIDGHRSGCATYTKLGPTAEIVTLPDLAPGMASHAIVSLLATAPSRNGPDWAPAKIFVRSTASSPDFAPGHVEAAADASEHNFEIVAGGFPRRSSSGGLLKYGSTAEVLVVDIPLDRVDGATELVVQVYPSPAASLASALESLLREPCGCFEQSASTTYPVVLALSYFLSKGERRGVSDRVDKALAILERGYAKLTSFQTQDGGFEWFGHEPAHEALTAYGVRTAPAHKCHCIYVKYLCPFFFLLFLRFCSFTTCSGSHQDSLRMLC